MRKVTCRMCDPCHALQDALKECLPDMPREDRQLLMLRFVREVDQSIDYDEVDDRGWVRANCASFLLLTHLGEML